MNLSIFKTEIMMPIGVLIPMNKSHAPDVVRWRNDPEIAVRFATKHKFTVESHNSWLDNAKERGDDFNWIICDLKNRPLGAIGLYNIDPVSKSAEIGRILIGEYWARKRGYGRSALQAIIKLCVASGNILCIYLTVRTDNIFAVSLYRSLGFEDFLQEGEFLQMNLQLRGRTDSVSTF